MSMKFDNIILEFIKTEERRLKVMKYSVISLYFVFWIILCETLNLEVAIIGIFLCFFVFKFNKDMIVNGKKIDRFKAKNLLYIIQYAGILIKEIFKSNFHVAKIVLSPKMNISPQVVKINTEIKSDLYKTMLANSITLTPGTLTLLMNNNELTIHCLQKENIKGLYNSDFENILLKAEEDKDD